MTYPPSSPPPPDDGYPPPPGQGYPPPGQGYPAPGSGAPNPGASYPPPGQAYPPPGQSYPPPGQPQGQGYPPGQQGFPPGQPPGYGFQPAPPKKSNVAKILTIVGIVVLLLCTGLGVGGWFLWKRVESWAASDSSNAKTGDCLSEDDQLANTPSASSDRDAKIVKCSSPDAAYTVVARINTVGIATSSQSQCERYFTKEGVAYATLRIYSEGDVDLLCLEPRK